MQFPTIDESRYEAFDVVVAGGGMAGIAAAIAAGRGGAKTLLIDKAGWLGGMGITGATGLHTFYNVFDPVPGAPRLKLVEGIAQELVDRVKQLGGALGERGHIRIEKGGDFVSMLTTVEPETFKLAAFQLLQEAGVRLLLHTVLDEVRAADGQVEGIVVWNKAGRSLVRGKVYIDCTGDGDLAAYAGAKFETYKPGDDGAYAAGFTFRICNIDLETAEADLERRGLIRHVAHAVKPGMSKPELVRISLHVNELQQSEEQKVLEYFFACSLRPREFTYCNCINYGPNDGLDPDALTNAEMSLRQRMFAVAEVFRRNVKGFEGCYVAGPTPAAGQRRGRAIHCDYELTQADCTEAHRGEDEIGIYGFIDNHHFFVKEAGAYGIPYRALLPVGLDNVLIAGRMMTVETVAHNSTRNTVCCLICGQAAGTAAALAAAKAIAPRKLDPQQLRAQLKKDGVLLEPKQEPLEG